MLVQFARVAFFFELALDEARHLAKGRNEFIVNDDFVFGELDLLLADLVNVLLLEIHEQDEEADQVF